MPDLVPLTFDMIEGGQLREDFEEAFRSVQSHLNAHCERYKDRAKGAKVAIVLQIELVASNPTDLFFEVRPKITTKAPERPVRNTSVVGGYGSGERPQMFCRPEGTDKDNPHQRTFIQEASLKEKSQ